MRIWLFASLFAIACCSGCGSPTGASASGKVTLNGQPLDFGLIQFVSSPERGPTASMQIVHGEYRGPAFAGTKRVYLSMDKVVGKRKLRDGSETDIAEEALPARYNTESKLTIEIKPGANEFNFDLTTP